MRPSLRKRFMKKLTRERVVPIISASVRSELIVQNDIDERLMDPDAAVVIDEAKLAKAIHEEADAGAGGADHLRQRLLRDGRKRSRFSGLAEFGHQQKDSGQPLVVGGEGR